MFSLTVSEIPEVGWPTGAQFLWAIGIGARAAVVATGIFRLARLLRPLVEPGRVFLTPLVGLAVGGLAVLFEATTDRSSSEVLFSGQDALPSLVQQASGWSVGALLMLLLCKGLAYALSLSSFRGGPIFPSMYIGAAGGIALSHLGGSLPVIAGAAMGIRAMTAATLKMPLTAALLPSLLFASDAANLIPVVIVAVVVSYVVSVRINPNPVDTEAHDSDPAPDREESRLTAPLSGQPTQLQRQCRKYEADRVSANEDSLKSGNVTNLAVATFASSGGTRIPRIDESEPPSLRTIVHPIVATCALRAGSASSSTTSVEVVPG